MKRIDCIMITEGARGKVFFTTDSVHSHYGIPVVRVEAPGETHDLGPGDEVPGCLQTQEHIDTFGKVPNMAARVYSALLVNMNPENVAAFYLWSAQLPGYAEELPGYPRD